MSDMNNLDYEDLAIVGYQAYGDEANWLTWDNKQMPPWEGIGDIVRSRWIAAAKAIFEVSQPRA